MLNPASRESRRRLMRHASLGAVPGHDGGLAEVGIQGIKRLSLSVERDNPATALYQRLGFRPLDRGGSALTW